MSKITLIRHGQASFGAKNYDLLSDIGRQQAAALGEYFLEHKIEFDKIIHGDMFRQTETAQIVANTCGFSDPLILDSGANEFNSDRLLSYYLPKLAETSDKHHQIIYAEQAWFNKQEYFERIFRELINLWQHDDNCPFESWSSFKQRILAMLNQIKSDHASDQRIALVTSGGLISVTMQSILGFDNQTFMDMNLTINNASLTEIIIQPLAKNTDYKQKIEAKLLSFNNVTPLLIKKQKHLITRK